jgi:arabinose-5-phosphate isomerase
MTRLVRDLMRIGVPTCELETSLVQVAKIMARDNAAAVVVMGEFGAWGVVTESDLVKAFTRNYNMLTASDVMSDRIIAIPPDVSITAAAHMLTDEKVDQVFVMHDHPGPSRPSAILTLHAIVRELAGLEPEKPPEMKKLFARQSSS